MKKVLFISMCRSDYQTIAPVFSEFRSQGFFRTELVCGGSHLLERYGESFKEIKAEFSDTVLALRFLNESDNRPDELVNASGRLMTLFNNYLSASNPDAVFIVGDRWELLPLAFVCFLRRTPLMHHSGGDITQGSMDNQARYSVTKLADLHFVAIEEHKQRLIRTGEEEWRVHVVGEPALQTAEDLACDINHGSEMPVRTHTLATFHPCLEDTLEIKEQADFFIKCLDLIKGKIIVTAPNPDAYSDQIYNKINTYVSGRVDAELHKNLGNSYYEYLMRSTLMIGNSSSGIWEAATFKVPVINIGSRQEGRTRQSNIIDVEFDYDKVLHALEIITSKNFKSSMQDIRNLYYNKESVSLIHSNLQRKLNNANLMHKRILL